MDVERIKELYALASKGDFDGQRALLADNYQHHIVAMGVDIDGADATIAAMRNMSEALPMTWTSDRVEEHGVFAVSFSTGEVQGMEPFKALNIYRFDGDLIAEGWVLAPPMG